MTVHVLVVLLHPVQVYAIGVFVHEAVNVSVLLTAGDDGDGVMEHDGVGEGGGGGGPDGTLLHSTWTPDFGLAPALFRAINA